MNDVERASSTGISRRTVTKAMAWAAPAIAVAAPVPAFAASGCLGIPLPDAWDITTRHVNRVARGNYNPPNQNIFTMWEDSTRRRGLNDAYLQALSGHIPLDGTCSGKRQYTLDTRIRTQTGYIDQERDGSCIHYNTRMELSWRDSTSASWTSIFSVDTQPGYGATYTQDNWLTRPGGACGGWTNNYPYNPYPQGHGFGPEVLRTVTITPAAGATWIELKMYFTIWGNNEAANDDYNIELQFTDCECVY